MNSIIKYIVIIMIVMSPNIGLADKWQIDPDHSSFRFGVKHIHSTITGHFSNYDARISFDPDNLDKSSFDFAIKVRSINTFHAKRDTHLRSKDFFNADKFPEMVFKSSGVFHKKDNIYGLEGKMTIKNVTQKITIEFTYFQPTPSPFDKKIMVAGFDAFFKLDRLKYNVGNGKFYKMGVVGKNVDIFISVEAHKK